MHFAQDTITRGLAPHCITFIYLVPDDSITKRALEVFEERLTGNPIEPHLKDMEEVFKKTPIICVKLELNYQKATNH